MTALEGAGPSATEISERLAELYRQKDAAIEALVGAAGAAGGAARRARPAGRARPLRRAAGGGAGAGGDARRRGEPGGGDHRAAGRAPRAEGCGGRDAGGAAGAAGGAARRDSTRRARSTASPSGWRRCRPGWRARRGGEPGGGDHRAAGRAPRAEGCGGRDAGGAAGAAGGAARRARPAGGARPLRRAAGGGAGPGGALEGAENPVAEITERLAGLHAQKDVAVEALVSRLAPLEARLAEIDPQGALDRFAERLEAVQAGWRARRGGEPGGGDHRAARRAPCAEGRARSRRWSSGWRRWRRGSPRSRAGWRGCCRSPRTTRGRRSRR